MNLTLVKQEEFNGVVCDFYSGADYGEDIWMTRTQIGEALEYEDANQAIKNIHLRHRDRLDKFSRVAQIETPYGKQEMTIYSAKGIYEICRFSRQPKADMFMDWCWDVIEKIRKGTFRADTGRPAETFSPEFIKEVIESVAAAIMQIVPVVIKETANAFAEKKAAPVTGRAKIIPLRHRHKVEMLPEEIKETVDQMLSSPQRNFAHISRFLRSQGFSISSMSIKRYFDKHFRTDR